MKQEALENVISAIREVLAGRPYLSHDMSAKLITNFASGSNQANPTDRLSDRELEILELIGKGRDVHEIARALQPHRRGEFESAARQRDAMDCGRCEAAALAGGIMVCQRS